MTVMVFCASVRHNDGDCAFDDVDDDDKCTHDDNDDARVVVFNVGACNQSDMKEGDHVTEPFHLWSAGEARHKTMMILMTMTMMNDDDYCDDDKCDDDANGDDEENADELDYP